MSVSWSTNKRSKLMISGYGGLTYTKDLIMPYFPKKIIRFVEPFAGLGRISEMVNAEELYLNDLSDYAVNTLKNKFSQTTFNNQKINYKIEQMDFRDFIKKYDSEDSFIFCDPPWRKNIYANHEKPAFTEKRIIDYYEALLEILPQCKGDWMITSDRDEHENGRRLQKSGYTNIVLEATDKPKFYGRNPAVRLCSNLNRSFEL